MDGSVGHDLGGSSATLRLPRGFLPVESNDIGAPVLKRVQNQGAPLSRKTKVRRHYDFSFSRRDTCYVGIECAYCHCSFCPCFISSTVAPNRWRVMQVNLSSFLVVVTVGQRWFALFWTAIRRPAADPRLNFSSGTRIQP